MNKIYLILAMTLVSFASFAQTLDQSPYAAHCHGAGEQKVTSQAEAFGVVLTEDVHACEIDARWYNPSKYIWYCAKAKDANGVESTVTSLVQYYFKRCI